MERDIIKIIKAYSDEPAAFLAMYSIPYIVCAIKEGYTVINNECTQELNEVI